MNYGMLRINKFVLETEYRHFLRWEMVALGHTDYIKISV